jgi:hypothetical protein
MNDDDIIRMAREAGVANSWDINWFDPYYARFANLVAAAERERVLLLRSMQRLIWKLPKLYAQGGRNDAY